MISGTVSFLWLRHAYRRIAGWRARTALFVSLCAMPALIAGGPAFAEQVYTAADGMRISYSTGTFDVSDAHGPQFMDLADVVIEVPDGKRFTADKLLVSATGALNRVDSIEQAEIINAKFTAPSDSGYRWELTVGLLQIENIHFKQPETIAGLSDKLQRDRNKPSYFRLEDLKLAAHENGLQFEIERFVTDANPGLGKKDLPAGQYASEMKLTNARIVPLGSGEASLIYQLILSGMNIDAIRLDMQGSVLNQFSPTHINSDARLEIKLDRVFGLGLDVETLIDADDYGFLLTQQFNLRPGYDPEIGVAQVAGYVETLSVTLSDLGASQIYDSLSARFGWPGRRQLAQLATYHIEEQLGGHAPLLSDPIADFIRTGGQLILSAQPNRLAEQDRDMLLYAVINKADIRLYHTP